MLISLQSSISKLARHPGNLKLAQVNPFLDRYSGETIKNV